MPVIYVPGALTAGCVRLQARVCPGLRWLLEWLFRAGRPADRRPEGKRLRITRAEPPLSLVPF